ncbi:ABC transporter ATP-binding protein [Pectobacterium brasiliense]|uniref:ABC transporter ATP-binding protein n=1 Tax=Pectobacterium brasiliense TaxID=180957 RepID=UPI0015DED916|nr:ABC transporter ATP-binding protein [Pectobacterium brasiliense]MBA0207987.1 ABC transporter ATP-binding protein [Pectobacterium brasiliense]
MLELHRVSKSFNGRTVLSDIHLTLENSRRTAIVGPSGSGKTTLLRLIAGFEKPDSGVITLNGQMLCDNGLSVPAHQRRIGYVPQDGALFPHLCIADNIAFGLKGSKAEKQKRVDELMALVSLPVHLQKHSPHEISGGQQQRVALARALAQRPALMLLDEPFSALDTGLRAATRKAVMDVLQQANVASILVTHDQGEALSFADHVVVMRDGQLSQSGSPWALYHQPANEDIATFLGETLILDAQIDGGQADCLLGRIAVDRPTASGKARIMLRPEQIAIQDAGVNNDKVDSNEANSAATVRATIRKVDFSGFASTLALHVHHATADIIELKTVSHAAFAVGQQVSLTVNGAAHVFSQ